MNDAVAALSALVSADASGEPGLVFVGAEPPGERATAYAYSRPAFARRARLKPANEPAVLAGPARLTEPKPGGKITGSGPAVAASRLASPESSMALIPAHTSLVQRIGASWPAGSSVPHSGT